MDDDFPTFSDADSYSDTYRNRAGTVLTCERTDCGCQLEIVQPCPHGDAYTCACGTPMS